MSTTIPDLTKDTFDEAVLSATTPLVVDFWAEWCPPCLALAPILEDLAHELAGTIGFAKVDVEAHPDLATRYQVLSFPTLLVFDDGQPVRRLIGLRGKRHLLEELDEVSRSRPAPSAQDAEGQAVVVPARAEVGQALQPSPQHR
jgi:thioredoxin 1